MNWVKNIADKNEELLKVIKCKIDIKSKIDLTSKAIAFIEEIRSIEENVDYDKFLFIGGNKKVYGLDSFETFEKLNKDIRYKNTTID